MYKITWQRKSYEDPEAGEAESQIREAYVPDYKTAWDLWWYFAEVYKYRRVEIFDCKQQRPCDPRKGVEGLL